ncbi:MAG: hypothetical protein VX910_01915 [Candidatus Latescibacterota bacterium]|nr:hypothetical protein [Candidatus Latescibacterota bacterium]
MRQQQSLSDIQSYLIGHLLRPELTAIDHQSFAILHYDISATRIVNAVEMFSDLVQNPLL